MPKCLMPERVERAERLKKIARVLLDEPMTQAERSDLYKYGAGLKVIVTGDQPYEHRLLKIALRREVSKRTGVMNG